MQRTAKFIQLGTIAFICAFGGRFRLTNLHRKEYNLDDDSSERVTNLLAVGAFQGITVAFSLGRLLMAVQYSLGAYDFTKLTRFSDRHQ